MYNEVSFGARAHSRVPKCKGLPGCNGLGCGNTMPSPGSKAPVATAQNTTTRAACGGA